MVPAAGPPLGAGLGAAIPAAGPPLGTGLGEAVGATSGAGTGLGTALRTMGQVKDDPPSPLGRASTRAVGEAVVAPAPLTVAARAMTAQAASVRPSRPAG